jgi:uncharacterized protein YggE
MRLRFVTVLLVTLLYASTHAQTIQTQPSNTVAVSADGTYETSPDTGVLQFDISAQEKTSAAAYARLSRSTDAVRQALKSQDIEVKAAELSRFSVHPIVDWKSNTKRKVVAYRLNTRVSLNIKDFSKIGPLTESLAAIDDVENEVVTYTLENPDQAKKIAVENGIARAHEMAETAAKKSGHSLGGLTVMSVDTSARSVAPPYKSPYDYLARRMKFEVAEATSMEAVADVDGGSLVTTEFGSKSITITAHVRAVFVLQ